MEIRTYFNGEQCFLIQVGIVFFFFSLPDLHGITVFRINILGSAGELSSETDVCLNVMFVAEAALTFQSQTFSPRLSPLGFVRRESLPDSG